MLIDFHIHAFPQRIANYAIGKLQGAARIQNYTDGTISATRQLLESWRVDLGVMLNIATNPKQQTNVNNFAARHNHGNILSFGSVHPDAPNKVEEVYRIKNELGLKGLKFHPDHQGFCPDDPKIFPVYEVCQQLDMPVVFHTGYDPYSPYFIHATPLRIAKVAQAFPHLTIIAAHMGGFMVDEAERFALKKYENLFFDTAFTCHYYDPSTLTRNILAFGSERVLFGSDCPWAPSDQMFALVEQTALSDRQKEQIYSANAKRLLGL